MWVFVSYVYTYYFGRELEKQTIAKTFPTIKLNVCVHEYGVV